jgi:hypothetical protein
MLIAAIESTRGTDRQIVSTDNQTLSEGGNAAIWEPTLNDWTPVGPLPGIPGAREAVWTGREVIAWSGAESWRWVPPRPPGDHSARVVGVSGDPVQD